MAALPGYVIKMNAHYEKPRVNPAFKIFQPLPPVPAEFKAREDGSTEFPGKEADKRLPPDIKPPATVNSNCYASFLH